MKTKNKMQITFKIKWIILLSMLLLVGNESALAQDQLLWTGAVNSSWQNPGNWLYVPTVGSPVAVSYYPGSPSGLNPNGPKDDVAIFNHESSVPVIIDRNCAGTSTTLRVGGILVEGYTANITQMDGNRFNVSEVADAGGYGVYDGVTKIHTDYSGLSLLDETPAYRAYFNFGVTGGFLGGTTTLGGSLSYAMLFAVPLQVHNIERFRAPKDELKIRQDAFFIDGADFDNSLHGNVILSCRNTGLNEHDYGFNNVVFWNLKTASNGGTGIPIKNFYGGSCTTENDFSTTGAMGVEGAGSNLYKLNSPDGSEILIKHDLIVGNVFHGPSYTAALDYGNIVLVINGAGEQHIKHTENEQSFNGNIPALRIEQTTIIGSVVLEGPTTVNNYIEFVKGIVYADPTDPATSQNNLDLTIPNLFIINSNTTVTGASDLSYCNGPIECRTGKSIELPLGKSHTYRPAKMNAISGVSIDYSSDNMYIAEYFEGTPVVGVVNRETSLSAVSNCELWAIQKAAITDSYVLDLELGYDPIIGSCTDFLYAPDCQLVLSRWDVSANEWVSHGGDAGTTSHGDLTIGSTIDITTADFERSTNRPDLFTFGDYSLPSCDSCSVGVYANYCVDSCEFAFETVFDLGIGSTFYSVHWDFGDGTSDVLSPTHTFTSLGYHEVSVTVCAISGVDTCCATYTFGVYSNDCALTMSMAALDSPEIGETDALIELAKLEEQNSRSDNGLEISPNPSFSNFINLKLKSTEKGSFNFDIVNGQGQHLMQGVLVSNEINTLDISALSPGIYLMTVYLSNSIITERIVVGK